MAHSMPRLDVLRAETTPTAYRSGFWGMARIAPRPAAAACELGLLARFAGGGEERAELARIPLARSAEPIAESAPTVAICMAAYEPPMELFRRQLDSIRAQTERDWLCVISDDCSAPERFAAMREAVAGDPRFVLARSDRRLGFYRNFERALALAPRGARFVAMSDQDDFWHADKLATLLAANRRRAAGLQRRADRQPGRAS